MNEFYTTILRGWGARPTRDPASAEAKNEAKTSTDGSESQQLLLPLRFHRRHLPTPRRIRSLPFSLGSGAEASWNGQKLGWGKRRVGRAQAQLKQSRRSWRQKSEEWGGWGRGRPLAPRGRQGLEGRDLPLLSLGAERVSSLSQLGRN